MDLGIKKLCLYRNINFYIMVFREGCTKVDF